MCICSGLCDFPVALACDRVACLDAVDRINDRCDAAVAVIIEAIPGGCFAVVCHAAQVVVAVVGVVQCIAVAISGIVQCIAVRECIVAIGQQGLRSDADRSGYAEGIIPETVAKSVMGDGRQPVSGIVIIGGGEGVAACCL